MPDLPSQRNAISAMATAHGAKNVRIFGSYATGVNLDTVWLVVENRLPNLKKHVLFLINSH